MNQVQHARAREDVVDSSVSDIIQAGYNLSIDKELAKGRIHLKIKIWWKISLSTHPSSCNLILPAIVPPGVPPEMMPPRVEDSVGVVVKTIIGICLMVLNRSN